MAYLLRINYIPKSVNLHKNLRSMPNVLLSSDF